MKKIIAIAIVTLSLSLTVTSCKKTASPSPDTPAAVVTPPAASTGTLAGKWYSPGVETMTFNSNLILDYKQNWGSQGSYQGTYSIKGMDSVVIVFVPGPACPFNYTSRAQFTHLTDSTMTLTYASSGAPQLPLLYHLIP